MKPHDVKTANDAARIVEERGIDFVKIGVFDIDGILRGKYMSRRDFLEALADGWPFCDVVLGWDSNDETYDRSSYTGWQTGYPDAHLRVIPESCREIPFEPETLLFLSEFRDAAEEVCPRGALRRVLDRAGALGYTTTAAAEFEFFVFAETPESVREKGYRNLRTFTPGFFGYSVLRNSVHADFFQELIEFTKAMDMPVDSLHTETGPGVIEAAIAYDEALAAADKAALFKTFTKVMCERRELMATFMAKWSTDYPGQSGHIHVSLRDGDGRPVFRDESRPDQMSDTMRHFVGGQQALMPELCAMFAPTVNSYTRLIPGFWAPTAATFGIENRTCALRAILGSAASQRVEVRIGAADINPYLAIAAAIGSGLWGVENEIEPDEPLVGDAYSQDVPAERELPRTLFDAASRLRGSSAARDLFGDAFVDHFYVSREWEQRQYRGAVTDWELRRYFEII